MNSIIEFFKANRESIIKPTFVLFSICVIITLALSGTNLITADKIDEMALEKQREAMARVLQADEYNEAELKTDDGEITYNEAVESDETKGYIFVVQEKGYGGKVSVMTAVNTSGEITGVDILDVTTETPGLGQNAANEKFFRQYSGKTDSIKVVKNNPEEANGEIEAVTGATITSKAVTRAVNRALEYYKLIAATGKSAVQGEITYEE